MNIDEMDIKVLKENFDQEMIRKVDSENIAKIINYLLDNGIYFAKDIFLTYLDLFLLDKKEFIDKFENVKKNLGNDFVEKMEEDFSLMEMMYE